MNNHNIIGSLLIIALVSCEKTAPTPPATKKPKTSDQLLEIVDTDKAQIVKAILDQADIQEFFHPDVHGRVPVLVSDLNLTDIGSIQIIKFNKPIKIIPDEDCTEDKAYFRFVEFNLSDNSCSLSFEYPIEGLIGNIKLSKVKNIWQLTDKHIAEK